MPEFNEGQQRAISSVEGPVLCIAGPGSGKTTAMVHRVQYMIEEKNIPPEKILVITFTRASAREMEQRFLHLVRGKHTGVTFGTFHSVFFSILKRAYGYRTGDIVTEEEKYRLLRNIIRAKQMEYEDEEDVITSFIQELGQMKSDMIPLEHFYSSCMGESVFRDIVREYEKEIIKAGKLDFDDMMVYCYELLMERQDIRQSLQKQYEYILVDEFQDINTIQYEITKMLAAPENNLFIVGDDDQSIYGFRGSKPEIMLHFKEDYPDAIEAFLQVNYRCSRNITEGALRVIGHNEVRFSKEIISGKDYEQPIGVHHVKSIKEECDHVLEKIRQYRKEGIPYEDMAVIMRTNVQARMVVNRFMDYNIPFQMRDKMPCIYDHFAVQNVLDYIRAAMGIRDRGLFLRILNKPNRYLSRELLHAPQFSFEDMKRQLKDKDWMIERLEQWEYELKILSGLKPFAAVNFVRKAIGYDEYLKDYAKFRHIPVEDLLGTLDELQELAKTFKTFGEWFDGIQAYRNSLEEHMEKGKQDLTRGVTITTMHSAKGLEYDVVFLLEANEGMTPYKKAGKPEEIEEERRMFYVAMTRAKNHLHIYDVKDYYNKELEPSRFLLELCEDINS